MNTLKLEARLENLDTVNDFIDEQLKGYEYSMKFDAQVKTAVEEIFVNVCSYAYSTDEKPMTILCDVSGDPPRISITFIDRGVPYDPLAKADPNIEAPAEERGIGGLGIYMVKKSMDEVRYEYKDEQNMFTIVKIL